MTKLVTKITQGFLEITFSLAKKFFSFFGQSQICDPPIIFGSDSLQIALSLQSVKMLGDGRARSLGNLAEFRGFYAG